MTLSNAARWMARRAGGARAQALTTLLAATLAGLSPCAPSAQAADRVGALAPASAPQPRMRATIDAVAAAPRPRPNQSAAAARPPVAGAPRPRLRPTAHPALISAARVGAAGPASATRPIPARLATLRDAVPFDETALLGVFEGPKGRAALLRLRTGALQRVETGAQVEGWTVSRIDAAAVQMRNGVQRRRLVMPSP